MLTSKSNSIHLVMCLTLGTILSTASWSSFAAESIDQLSTRIGMDHFREAIKKGDRNGFKTLPAKGFKNGLTGLLLKTDTYVNPKYSFADCDTDTVIVSISENKTLPGCRISLKLATKDSNGDYQDNGIRVEYGIATGSKKFIANNSAWANYAITGNKVLEYSLLADSGKLDAGKNAGCNMWSSLAKNMATARDNNIPMSEYDKKFESLRGKEGITEDNITFSHYLARYVYQDMSAKSPQEVEALVYQVCQAGM